jgi:hypothetical protein
MKRPWLIRTLLLTLLLLSVAAWVCSYSRGNDLAYHHAGDSLECTIIYGELWVVWKVHNQDDMHTEGFTFSHFPVPAGYSLTAIRHWPATFYFLGFIADRHESGYFGLRRQAALPFWFLTSTLALASIYIWRKTRPSLNPQSAFPIDLKRPHA